MKRLERACLAVSALALIHVSARVAAAQPAASKLNDASNFFDAGAQAYKAGQYLVAAEAFMKANEIAPSPALLFSAAQAYRRQFLAEPSPDPLRRAISLYRDYLRLDKSPKRREDAMQALGSLLPLEARFPADGAPEPGKEALKQTRLLLSSAAEGAEVSVDGGPYQLTPRVHKVPPGPHRVHVRAPGYQDEQLSVVAVESELLPRHVVLEPKPAHLLIHGTSGARLEIDGQLRATLPLSGPITIAPGVHFVAVTHTGHRPWSEVIEAQRDETVERRADLSATRQRVAAWTTITAGAVGAVVAGVLTGVTLARQGEATTLRDKRDTTPLTPVERDQYNAAIGARDDFARAAAVTGGVSAVVLATGFGLLAFDRPEVVPPSDDRLKPPSQKGPRVELEVGLMSIGLRGSF